MPTLEQNPLPPANSPSVHVIPLPIALYVSNGLIFELYDGGQLRRSFSFRWETLVPAAENMPEPDLHEARIVLTAHQD